MPWPRCLPASAALAGRPASQPQPHRGLGDTPPGTLFRRSGSVAWQTSIAQSSHAVTSLAATWNTKHRTSRMASLFFPVLGRPQPTFCLLPRCSHLSSPALHRCPWVAGRRGAPRTRPAAPLAARGSHGFALGRVAPALRGVALSLLGPADTDADSTDAGRPTLRALLRRRLGR